MKRKLLFVALSLIIMCLFTSCISFDLDYLRQLLTESLSKESSDITALENFYLPLLIVISLVMFLLISSDKVSVCEYNSFAKIIVLIMLFTTFIMAISIYIFMKTI